MLNADDTDVLEVQDDLYDKNIFTYCDNNPIMRADYGGYIWDFIDFGFAAWSWGDMIANPSWGNFGWAMLDTVCLLPIIPSVGYVTRPGKIFSKASKTSKISKITKILKYKKYTENANKIHHMFSQGRHQFGNLLKKFGGSEKKAYNAIYDATFNYAKSKKITGLFETTVKVKGISVGVRGNVVDGIVRLSTSFIR